MGDLQMLNGREYKLLLDAARFCGEPAELAGAFWEDRLKPIIADALDGRKSGKPRHKKSFGEPRTRRLRFWDTGERSLAAHDYSLRERVDLKHGAEDDASRELSLKLRTPDLFVAALTDLRSTAPDARTKFEEDIAPLGIVAGTEDDRAPVRLAEPPSIRSRFSLTTAQKMAAAARPKTLGDLLSLYPALGEDIGSASADLALKAGGDIEEVLLKGAAVDLGGDIDGVFTMTFWRFKRGSARPDIAEISFRYDTENGISPRNAALRALRLFTAIQKGLGELVDLRETSKTARALPG